MKEETETKKGRKARKKEMLIERRQRQRARAQPVCDVTTCFQIDVRCNQ
jgi:hypothetical protein